MVLSAPVQERPAPHLGTWFDHRQLASLRVRRRYGSPARLMQDRWLQFPCVVPAAPSRGRGGHWQARRRGHALIRYLPDLAATARLASRTESTVMMRACLPRIHAA